MITLFRLSSSRPWNRLQLSHKSTNLSVSERDWILSGRTIIRHHPSNFLTPCCSKTFEAVVSFFGLEGLLHKFGQTRFFCTASISLSLISVNTHILTHHKHSSAPTQTHAHTHTRTHNCTRTNTRTHNYTQTHTRVHPAEMLIAELFRLLTSSCFFSNDANDASCSTKLTNQATKNSF